MICSHLLLLECIMATYDFQTRLVYSFNLYPSPILGSGFKNVTVQAILDYSTALGFADIEALHENVFQYLPSGTPNRPQDFDYLLLRTDSGATTVIGVPWIIEESIQLIESLTMNVTIEGVSTADGERIRACLSQNGYDKIQIAIVSK